MLRVLLFSLFTAAASAHSSYALCRPIASKRSALANAPLAMAIPGDSMGEAILVDGSLNFLGIYMGVLSLRIRACNLPPPTRSSTTARPWCAPRFAQSVSLCEPALAEVL